MPEFTKREKILLMLLAAVSVFAAVSAYWAFFAKSPDVAFRLENGPAVTVFQPAGDTLQDPAQPAKIVVHVAGAVKRPGVYELDEGRRVIDAIEAAGGCLSEADLASLNLARKLRDEDKLYVPRIGEFPVTGSAGSAGANGGASSAADGRININTAGLEELDKLPGIGPALAQRIIDYRNQHGPFKSVEELKNVSGIGEKKFEELKDLVKVN
ncbi:helix-hairpin-helix domain-containing protein [Thermosediminibacter oceani]|uniref:Competence protein ComEA helix-hairpin-helix repeat protein n=1 Tax=Thermosediminibacter oceani (strain ATCC BAA-1034 / DSM 16646 / JW/IW-1228P) TaxID=555079 RepID=D9S2B2_THEOJ|nr:helix-hairpin-helix domain-containing protein [Thermosediminibacter oceani]ADL07539.1 competence protein ComEA helix-hairpin-helix repeat protein [Thermosediminibacter oceani DSM 16646]